jgi:hypothetical protein
MTTTVQRFYAPQQRPALVGMLADTSLYDAHTRVVETAAGIGPGLAVSQGTLSDRGCILGGSKFVGVLSRDPTIVPGTPIDPLFTGNPFAADLFPPKFNAPVLTRGRIWVQALAKVSARDAAYYNTTDGGFANSASGETAFGYIQFSANPAPSSTITLNGSVWTFVASGATGLQTNIKGTLGDTLTQLAADLSASADTQVVKFVYEAYPPSPGGAGQGSGAYQLNIGAAAPGTAGNALTLATSVAGATLSGATLAGGSAAATAVPNGFWVSSALPGDLAILSLNLNN